MILLKCHGAREKLPAGSRCEGERAADNGMGDRGHGIGLGLAICRMRMIVTAHGGRLWATNNAMHGASLRLCLPGGSLSCPAIVSSIVNHASCKPPSSALPAARLFFSDRGEISAADSRSDS
jgi:hypothetical protein